MENEDQISEAVQIYRAQLPALTSYLPAFLQAFLPPAELESSKRFDPTKTITVEQFIKAKHVVQIDGFIDANSEVTIWALVDNNYHQSRVLSFSDCTLPSRLYEESPHQVEQVEKFFIRIAKDLARKGFKSTFCFAEIFILHTGELKLLEVNSRMCAQLTPLYRKILTHGDPYTAQIELSRGRTPKRPEMSSGIVGSNVYINVFLAKSERAEDVLDFEIIDKLAKGQKSFELDLKVGPDDVLEKSDQSCGSLIGFLYVYSSSYRKNVQISTRVQRRILKKPELAPWHPMHRVD